MPSNFAHWHNPPKGTIMANAKQNWFPTLNAALESEGLLESWDCCWGGISYGQTYSYTWQDGSKRGRFVSIYRDERGFYERPVSYAR